MFKSVSYNNKSPSSFKMELLSIPPQITASYAAMDNTAAHQQQTAQAQRHRSGWRQQEQG
jgi:hypothetical protein